MPKIKTALKISFLLFILCIAAVFIFGNRLILKKAENLIQSKFPGSIAVIQSAELHGNNLALKKISVKSKNLEMRSDEIQIFFNWGELLKGRVSRIWISNSDLQAHGPAASILSSLPSSSGNNKPSSTIRVNILQVSDIAVTIKSDALNLKGTLSFLSDLGSQKPLLFNALIDSAENGQFSVKNAHLYYDQKAQGKLTIEKISYQKLDILDIKGPFRLENNTLIFEPLKAALLNGSADGMLSIRLDGDAAYKLDMKLEQLDVPSLISDLKYDEKLSMTGKFLGKISLTGSRSGLATVDGSLSGAGGDLVIRDQAFLQNIADRMKQPIALVEAGLKEYHYDSGSAHLLKNERDLTLELDLDGPKGKRQVSTVFHDTF